MDRDGTLSFLEEGDIREGITMNQSIAAEGLQLHKVGYYLDDLKRKKFLQDDVCSSRIASARGWRTSSDARNASRRARTACLRIEPWRTPA